MKEQINSQSKIKIPAKIFHKNIASKHIITHPTKPSWMIVNDFGWRIIKLLNGKNTLADIVKILQSEYAVNEELLKKDIDEFILDVEKSGMLSDESEKIDPQSNRITNAFIHITENCNLNCKHCYAMKMSQNAIELTGIEIINLLNKFYAAGGKSITLSGGEPLMRSDLKSILNISRNVDLQLLSNGTLINDDFVDFISELNISIQVSIDGSNEAIHDRNRGTGSFNAAMAGIEKLQKKGLGNKINLCTTVMSQNYGDLPNIIELSHVMGIKYIRFLPLLKLGNACNNWDEIQRSLTQKDYEDFYYYIFEEAQNRYPDIVISSGLSGFILNSVNLKKNNNWCPVGSRIVIDTTGNVYPCDFLMTEFYKMGNIRTSNLDEIIKSPVLASLIKAKHERKNKISTCRNCMWKNFCLSGCMGKALHHAGTIWGTDQFCEFRKTLYEKAVLKMANKKEFLNYQGYISECN
jgi:radical SAM protein with 4Fe4S-binding SPASM domain